jgi:hypothetical protein
MEQLQNRQRSTFAFFADSFATFAVKSFFSWQAQRLEPSGLHAIAVEHWAFALR